MRVLAAGLVFIAFGWGAVAHGATEQPAEPAQTPQCAAGKQLVGAEQLEAAKLRYNKALDDEGAKGRECGVHGLTAIAAIEDAAAKDEKTLDLGDAWTKTKDWFTGNRAWIGLVVAFWVALALAYWIRIQMGNDQRVRVRAPASSADLATAVVAAANAAGGRDASTAKVFIAADETSDTDAADLAKIFRVPGTVPIGDLLKRPPFSGWFSLRLAVTGSIAGGWAVIELTYRQRWKPKRHVRIPIELGDIEDDEKKEVLALVGGAWLNAVLQTADPAPVLDRDDDGLRAHALFRAGANRQTLGKTHIALACYDAMPEKGYDAIAPFAWAGSRLNRMMALKTERRWLEAAQLANEIGDFPTEEIEPADRKRFGEKRLDELLLRQRYMTAILRVDHWYASKDQPPNAFNPKSVELKTKAEAAVANLEKLVGTDPGSGGELAPLHAAGRMVNLSYKIADGQGKTIDDVRRLLGLGGLTSTERPKVGAAAYYDAACAVSLLLEQLEIGNDDRPQRTREGLWLLETAVAATLEGRRGRVAEMAKADPMLEHLEKADPAGFAKAIGDDPPAEEKPKESAVPFYLAANGARSRSTASTSSS